MSTLFGNAVFAYSSIRPDFVERHKVLEDYFDNIMMMDTKRTQNFILTLFCLAVTWISVIHSDTGDYGFTGPYGFFNNVCDCYAIRTELVVKPRLSGNFQDRRLLVPLPRNPESFSEPLENNPFLAFRLFSPPYLLEQISCDQQIVSPLHRIISILHKTHTWHQSSDDDPFSHHLSLS